LGRRSSRGGRAVGGSDDSNDDGNADECDDGGEDDDHDGEDDDDHDYDYGHDSRDSKLFHIQSIIDDIISIDQSINLPVRTWSRGRSHSGWCTCI